MRADTAFLRTGDWLKPGRTRDQLRRQPAPLMTRGRARRLGGRSQALQHPARCQSHQGSLRETGTPERHNPAVKRHQSCTRPSPFDGSPPPLALNDRVCTTRQNSWCRQHATLLEWAACGAPTRAKVVSSRPVEAKVLNGQAWVKGGRARGVWVKGRGASGGEVARGRAAQKV